MFYKSFLAIFNSIVVKLQCKRKNVLHKIEYKYKAFLSIVSCNIYNSEQHDFQKLEHIIVICHFLQVH